MSIRIVASLSPMVFFAILASSPARAAEVNLGTHSPDAIKSACNASGGTLLGFSESGSYGCENSTTGGMVLCNKNQQCTGYTPARTRSEIKRLRNSMKLKTTVVTR